MTTLIRVNLTHLLAIALFLLPTLLSGQSEDFVLDFDDQQVQAELPADCGEITECHGMTIELTDGCYLEVDPSISGVLMAPGNLHFDLSSLSNLAEVRLTMVHFVPPGKATAELSGTGGTTIASRANTGTKQQETWIFTGSDLALATTLKISSHESCLESIAFEF